jgi:hypothetical protein
VIIPLCLPICCRDAPPNKLLLMPPIEEIETAFDNLVRLAFHAEKGGSYFFAPTTANHSRSQVIGSPFS